MESGKRGIPLLVGVTGHRDLRPEDGAVLLAAVTEALAQLRRRCPHTEIKLLCSLAAGADLLCADAAEKQGIPLMAALPMDLERYARGFNPADRERLFAHCRRAEAVFTVPPTEETPPEPTEDFFYRQAGIYVAEHARVLLALWDGLPGKPTGCGTAETVSFMLEGRYAPRDGLPLRQSDNGAVICVTAPRLGQKGSAGERRFLGDREALEACLCRTEEFNRLSESVAPEGAILPERREEDPLLDRMETLYGLADKLSLKSAGLFRRILAMMAASSTVLTTAFLLYDEAELIWMLFVCGGMLLGAFLCRRLAEKTACHRRYLEYRALAESLRVQAFLRYAGSSRNAAELMTWTQRQETGWVQDALCALTAGPAPGESRPIRDCWVEPQLRYHQGAKTRSRRREDRSDRVVRAATIASVVLYFAALIFEMCFGGLLFSPIRVLPKLDRWRAGLKIVLGSLSAATLFISAYYGKQSLSRKLSDHSKMEQFYAQVSRRLEREGQTPALLDRLAREELIENGNWCSYQRDNAPDFSL